MDFANYISPTEPKCWNRCLDVVYLSLWMWCLPSSHTFGWNSCWKKWPPKKWFQAVCDTQEAECWENYVPSRKERHQQRVNFQTFIYQELCRFYDVRLPVLPRGSTSRVRTLCFLALTQAFNHISYVISELPMRKQPVGMCWGCCMP